MPRGGFPVSLGEGEEDAASLQALLMSPPGTQVEARTETTPEKGTQVQIPTRLFNARKENV